MANLTAECRELVHRWVHTLAGEIGIRFAGTPGDQMKGPGDTHEGGSASP